MIHAPALDTSRRYLWHYDTWGEFVDYCTAAAPSSDALMKGDDLDWCPHDWRGTINAARYGWPEGLAAMERAKAQADAAALTLTERRPRLRYDVAGQRPHAARAAAGDPAAMVTRGADMGRKPVARINVSCSNWHGTPAERNPNKGAAILALVDLWEQSGTRCEIVATLASIADSEPDTVGALITVKRAEEPLDLDRLAFVLCHAGARRRLGFQHDDRRHTEEILKIAHLSCISGKGRQRKAIGSEGYLFHGLGKPDFGDEDQNYYKTPEQAMARVLELVELQTIKDAAA